MSARQFAHRAVQETRSTPGVHRGGAEGDRQATGHYLEQAGRGPARPDERGQLRLCDGLLAGARAEPPISRGACPPDDCPPHACAESAPEGFRMQGKTQSTQRGEACQSQADWLRVRTCNVYIGGVCVIPRHLHPEQDKQIHNTQRQTQRGHARIDRQSPPLAPPRHPRGLPAPLRAPAWPRPPLLEPKQLRRRRRLAARVLADRGWADGPLARHIPKLPQLRAEHMVHALASCGCGPATQ